MRILRHQDPDFPAAITALNRRALPAPDVEETVRGIIEGVRSRGDAALLEFTEKFDRVTLTAETLRETGEATVDDRIAAAIRTAHANVRDFALQSLRKSWSSRNAQGAMVGERFDPFERVGIYIPGGSAPLVSTAIMTVTLAAAAGVREIVVTTDAEGLYRFCGVPLHAEISLAAQAGAATAQRPLRTGERRLVAEDLVIDTR